MPEEHLFNKLTTAETLDSIVQSGLTQFRQQMNQQMLLFSHPKSDPILVSEVEADEDMAPCVPDRPRPNLQAAIRISDEGAHATIQPTFVKKAFFGINKQTHKMVLRCGYALLYDTCCVCLFVAFFLPWQHCTIHTLSIDQLTNGCSV